MKRHKDLYPAICSFANLLLAADRAVAGKRRRAPAARFQLRLEEELLTLQEELLCQTYRPGEYREFWVRDPKRRWVSAAPFRDRVVHHALCNVIEPIFDRTFIRDSYACRKGKGTHAAADRVTQLARRHPYVLQMDIAEYFPSLDREILRCAPARRIGCRGTLWLIDTIPAAGGGYRAAPRYYPGDDLFTPLERPRGIPLGNLTSQFFANVYLDPLDHCVTEVLRVPGYVRYVDDLLVFGHTKAELHECRQAIEDQLAQVRLALHPRKCRLYPVAEGISFVGYRLFPTHRRLLPANGYRFRRRLRRLVADYQARVLSFDRLNASVQSWIGHAKHADTWGLRRAVFTEVPLRAA